MENLALWQTLLLLAFCYIARWFWRPNLSRNKRNLLICLVVIFAACVHAKYMVDLADLIDVLAATGKTTSEEAVKAKATASIWAGIASLIVGGVGVNLLSSYFDS